MQPEESAQDGRRVRTTAEALDRAAVHDPGGLQLPRDPSGPPTRVLTLESLDQGRRGPIDARGGGLEGGASKASARWFDASDHGVRLEALRRCMPRAGRD